MLVQIQLLSPAKCDECGEAKPDVEEVADPYIEDVLNKTVLKMLCGDCYQKICWEI